LSGKGGGSQRTGTGGTPNNLLRSLRPGLAYDVVPEDE